MAKTLIAALTLAALLAPGLSSAGGIQSIVQKGEITVCMLESDVPPFLMSGPDGRLSGYDYEIAKGIASELGVRLKVKRDAKTFNELVDNVENGSADIALSKLSRTLVRAKKALFTEPYIVLRKALIVNRLELAKARGDESAQDFVKRFRGSLGVIKGSSYLEFASNMFPKAKIVPAETWAEVVEGVDSGALLCGFRDDLEVKRSMRSIPGASLRLTSVVFKDAEDPIAIAVGAEQIQLRLWIDEYLDERKLRITPDKLIDRYPDCARLQPLQAFKPAAGLATEKGAAAK